MGGVGSLLSGGKGRGYRRSYRSSASAGKKIKRSGLSKQVTLRGCGEGLRADRQEKKAGSRWDAVLSDGQLSPAPQTTGPVFILQPDARR